MRRCAVAALALTVAACHEVIELPAPDVGDAESLLLVHIIDGVVIRADALDLRGETPALPAFSETRTASTTTTYALTYRCSLEALGFSSGPQEVVPTNTDSVPTVPLPDRAQRLHRAGDEASWIDDPRDAALVELTRRSVHGAVGEVCNLFGGQLVLGRVRIPTPTALYRRPSVDAVVALGNGRALVVTSTAGRPFSWVVSLDGSVNEVSLTRRGAPGGALPEGELTGDGTGMLWHVGRDGTISRGTIEGGFEVIGSVGSFDPIRALALGSDESGQRLFVGGSTQGLARLTSLGATVSESLRINVPVMAAIDANTVLVTGMVLESHPLYRARLAGGRWIVTDEPVATPVLNDRFGAYTQGVSLLPGGGVVAISTHAEGGTFRNIRYSLSTYDGRAWSYVPGSLTGGVGAGVFRLDPRRYLVTDMSTFNDVSAIAIFDGALGYCHAFAFNHEFARSREFFHPNAIRVAPLDDTHLLVVPNLSPDDAQIFSVQDSSRACPVRD